MATARDNILYPTGKQISFPLWGELREDWSGKILYDHMKAWRESRPTTNTVMIPHKEENN